MMVREVKEAGKSSLHKENLTRQLLNLHENRVEVDKPDFPPDSAMQQSVMRDQKEKIGPCPDTRILIMDDDEMVRDVGVRILRRIGYKDTAVAADGAEALNVYDEAMRRGKPFDIVILDITVPGGMGGKETLIRLREMNPGVKVIASSGYRSEMDIAAYKRCGFRGAVCKPYTIDEMQKALHELIV